MSTVLKHNAILSKFPTRSLVLFYKLSCQDLQISQRETTLATILLYMSWLFQSVLVNFKFRAELYPAIILDEWKKLDKVDAEYFRESRESMFGGKKLEDLAAHPEVTVDLTITTTKKQQQD